MQPMVLVYKNLHDWVIFDKGKCWDSYSMEHMGRGKLPKGESCFGFLMQGVWVAGVAMVDLPYTSKQHLVGGLQQFLFFQILGI